MKITHIIFDLDNTLFDYNRAQRYALKGALEAFGIELTPEISSDYKAFNNVLWRQLELGEVTQDELKVKRFSQLLNKYCITGVEPLEINEKYIMYLSEGGFLLPGAEETVLKLKMDYTLAAATNGIPFVQWGRLKKSGLDKYFDKIFISEEIGYTKPDLRFFKSIFQLLDIKRPECSLLVGDSLTADISGGIGAGMVTCWVNGAMAENISGVKPDYEIPSVDMIWKVLDYIQK